MERLTEKAYTQVWNERYGQEGFAYGKGPNVFFKEWITQLEPGKILLPADGEGRNGVFAAQIGWETTATDLSPEGKEKALQLANELGTSLTYLVGDLEHMSFPKEHFDAIVLIYAHFLPEKKSLLHRKLDTFLRPGGTLILEAFGKNHLPYKKANPAVGGPGDLEMLYSVAELKEDFPGYKVRMLMETEVSLSEGAYHKGKGSVVRFVGAKPLTVS
ncbi:MAG: class I SAM-dependent methyltransferase [Bacteroidota bacterium]